MSRELAGGLKRATYSAPCVSLASNHRFLAHHAYRRGNYVFFAYAMHQPFGLIEPATSVHPPRALRVLPGI